MYEYLGAVVEETGDPEADVRESSSSLREVSGVICDLRRTRNVRINIYKTVLRLVLMDRAVYLRERLRNKEEQERK